MASTPLLDENSSDEQIVAYCADPPEDSLISKAQYSVKVVKLSDQVAVKFGFGILKEEADNQDRAYHLFDHNIVLIPKVYRYFKDDKDYGYLVMEYVDGHVKETLEESDIKTVTKVLQHFSTFHAESPGSLAGGPLRWLLFEEGVEFDSLEALEDWLNHRVFPHQSKISFQGCDLVPCHLDLAPRNILWKDDGRICLLDWESAGFVPRPLEFASQWINEEKDGTYNSLLLAHMQQLPKHELSQKDAFLQVWQNCQRYSL